MTDLTLKKHLPISRFLLLSFIILVPTLLLIGVLEGIYNHIVKNILFFGGVDEEVIINTFFGIFDSELVELPNVVFFELTGILQGFLVIPISTHFTRFMKYYLKHFFKK